MKKRLLPLLLIPLALTSCGDSSISLSEAEEIVSQYSTESLYPYYHVVGAIDYNKEVTPLDATFAKEPSTTEFVPYARYNDGFYNKKLDGDEEENVVIHGMASHSYWLRAPMRINAENFLKYIEELEEVYSDDEEAEPEYEVTYKENTSCAHYILEHLITSYIGKDANANPSSKSMYIEPLEGGGIAFGGHRVHTTVRIDNYPYYPDYEAHPELPKWKASNPLPCYQTSVNAKVNIRFEYDANGWLVKEEMTSIGYDASVASDSQISLVAIYSYKFGN